MAEDVTKPTEQTESTEPAVREFTIDATILVKDEKHVSFKVETDINESDPDFLKDEAAYDPNMLLFFWWTQAMASTAGLSDQGRVKLASDLFDIIINTENEAVANECITQELNLPQIPDDKGGEDMPAQGTHFINTTIRMVEGSGKSTISVETDIQNLEPNSDKNKVLYFYWSRAVASCAIALKTHAEKELLASRLCQALLDSDDTLGVSINDGTEQ